VRLTRSTPARLVAAVISALIVMVVWATPASAIVDPGLPNPDVLGVCPTQFVSQSVQDASQEYLPLNRWGGLVPVHTKLSWNPAGGDLGSKLQRDGVVTMGLSAGNGAWGVASGVVENATNFCVGSSIVQGVDNAIGTVGSALFGSGVIAIIFISGIAILIFRMRKNGSFDSSEWMRICMAAGVLAMLVFGAVQSTTNNGGSLGKGSPAWWSVRINQSVEQVAKIPAASLNDFATKTVNAAEPAARTSCAVYRANLREKYVAALKAVGGESTGESLGIVQSSIDRMWQDSGLRAWQAASFGTGNPWGDEVGCHLLERDRGTPVTEQIELSGLPNAATKPDAFIWNAGDNNQEDRMLVAWAACEYKSNDWQLRDGWKDLDGASDEACKDAFNGDSSFDGDGTILDWPADAEEIRTKTVDYPYITDFLLSLHGNENGSAMMIALAYMPAAVISLGVYGIFGVAIFAAKVYMLFLGALAVAMLIRSLFPGQRDAILPITKKYVGIAIFVFGASLILSLIAVVTSALVAAGTGGSTGSTISVWSVVWSSLAPVAALILVHQLFKQSGAPSPFTPSAALKWGAVLGGGGALAGVGLDRAMSQVGNRGRRLARGASSTAADALMGRRASKRIGALGAAAAAGGGAYAGTKLAERDDDTMPSPKDAAPDDAKDTAPIPNGDAEKTPRNRFDDAENPVDPTDDDDEADDTAPATGGRRSRIDGETSALDDPDQERGVDAPFEDGEDGGDVVERPRRIDGADSLGDDADAALIAAVASGGVAAGANVPRPTRDGDDVLDTAQRRASDRADGRQAARDQRNARSRIPGTREYEAAKKKEQREADAYAKRGNRELDPDKGFMGRRLEDAKMRLQFAPRRAASAVGGSARGMWDSYKDAPLRNTAKIALAAAAVAAVPVAAPVAFATAGTAYAANRLRAGRAEDRQAAKRGAPTRADQVSKANLAMFREQQEARARREAANAQAARETAPERGSPHNHLDDWRLPDVAPGLGQPTYPEVGPLGPELGSPAPDWDDKAPGASEPPSAPSPWTEPDVHSTPPSFDSVVGEMGTAAVAAGHYRNHDSAPSETTQPIVEQSRPVAPAVVDSQVRDNGQPASRLDSPPVAQPKGGTPPIDAPAVMPVRQVEQPTSRFDTPQATRSEAPSPGHHPATAPNRQPESRPVAPPVNPQFGQQSPPADRLAGPSTSGSQARQAPLTSPDRSSENRPVAPPVVSPQVRQERQGGTRLAPERQPQQGQVPVAATQTRQPVQPRQEDRPVAPPVQQPTGRMDAPVQQPPVQPQPENRLAAPPVQQPTDRMNAPVQQPPVQPRQENRPVADQPQPTDRMDAPVLAPPVQQPTGRMDAPVQQPPVQPQPENRLAAPPVQQPTDRMNAPVQQPPVQPRQENRPVADQPQPTDRMDAPVLAPPVQQPTGLMDASVQQPPVQPRQEDRPVAPPVQQPTGRLDASVQEPPVQPRQESRPVADQRQPESRPVAPPVQQPTGRLDASVQEPPVQPRQENRPVADQRQPESRPVAPPVQQPTGRMDASVQEPPVQPRQEDRPVAPPVQQPTGRLDASVQEPPVQPRQENRPVADQRQPESRPVAPPVQQPTGRMDASVQESPVQPRQEDRPVAPPVQQPTGRMDAPVQEPPVQPRQENRPVADQRQPESRPAAPPVQQPTDRMDASVQEPPVQPRQENRPVADQGQPESRPAAPPVQQPTDRMDASVQQSSGGAEAPARRPSRFESPSPQSDQSAAAPQEAPSEPSIHGAPRLRPDVVAPSEPGRRVSQPGGGTPPAIGETTRGEE
jgi:hypothetical protein